MYRLRTGVCRSYRLFFQPWLQRPFAVQAPVRKNQANQRFCSNCGTAVTII